MDGRYLPDVHRNVLLGTHIIDHWASHPFLVPVGDAAPIRFDPWHRSKAGTRDRVFCPWDAAFSRVPKRLHEAGYLALGCFLSGGHNILRRER